MPEHQPGLVPQVKKVEAKEPPRLEAAFLKTLAEYPEEIQAAFKQMPARLQTFLFAEQKKVAHKSRPTRSNEIIQYGTLEDWEESAREERRQRNEWTEEEVAELPAWHREIILSLSLTDFLHSLGIAEDGEPTVARLRPVMETLWANRGKRGAAIALYRAAYFAEQANERNILDADKQGMIDELNRLGRKKSLNRPAQKAQKELISKLAGDYGLIWHEGGKLFPTHLWPEKRDQLYALEQSAKAEAKERILQTTLAYLLDYYDAAEFAAMFQEKAESRFFFLKRRHPAKLLPIAQTVEEFYADHPNDQALKKDLGPPLSLNEKQQRLVAHMWRLFDSYLILKKNEAIPADEKKKRLDDTVLELTVALDLVQKTAGRK